MTKDQISLIRGICQKDDGTGNPIASVLSAIFNDEIMFRNTDDFIIYDDDNELIHAIKANYDNAISAATWPYKICTGFYGNIQFMEGLYNMTNFEKAIDQLFVDTGLIDEEKKEMIMKWASTIRNHANVPKAPGPYYPSVPQIPPRPPVPECRPDGIWHAEPIDQRTKKNIIFNLVEKAINNYKGDAIFKKIRPATYTVAYTGDNAELANTFKGFADTLGKNLFYASLTNDIKAAIIDPRVEASTDNFVNIAATEILPQQFNSTVNLKLYIEGYGVRVRYDFITTKCIDQDEAELWIQNTSNEVETFVNSISSDAIESSNIIGKNISITINTTDDLNIGLIDFLIGIDELDRVQWRYDNKINTLIVGDSNTYESFKEGVLKSMPTESGSINTSTMTMQAKNGASLEYTLKIKYFNEAEAVAKIGDTYYSKIENAFAKATSGQTIDILKDVSVDNTAVSANTNYPVLTINDGVTVNGNDHTISTKDWVTSPKGTYGTNHIIGISNGSATINNLTVIGNANAKSGIVCYGTGTNVTLNNVTAKDCGNCGVQVAGATVDATNLNTSGNTWGGVNVDKGSDGSIPAFTLHSGSFAENVEMYTEITDTDVITASGFSKVTGYGTNLKGFVYYTSDVSKLGKITGTDTVYETFADVTKNTPNATVSMNSNIDEDITIPIGANITIDGKSNTINGSINCEATGSSASSLTLKDMTLNGNGSKAFGIRSQNQTDSGQMELSLILNNVNITGFTNKAIYGTNIKVLNIDGGTINECATGAMDDPNTKGDYAIDLNLVAVQNTVATFNNVTFSGDLGDKAVVKITQRGGASDAGASDIPKGVGEAKVDSVTFTDCNFSGSSTTVDFRIGSDSKTEGEDIANTTGAYVVTITGTPMTVVSAYKVPETTLEIPEGSTASKEADGDIALDSTVDDQVNDIISGMTGVTVEPDPETPNTYSITTEDGIISDTGLFDQIAAIDGLASIVVSDGAGKTETYTAGGDLETFKTAVDNMIPKMMESGEVILTMTVNMQ